jgi:hypothetical protein
MMRRGEDEKMRRGEEEKRKGWIRIQSSSRKIISTRLTSR